MSPGGRSGSRCLTMPEYKAASAAPQAGSTKTLTIDKQRLSFFVVAFLVMIIIIKLLKPTCWCCLCSICSTRIKHKQDTTCPSTLVVFLLSCWPEESWARICERLKSPEIDSKESILPLYCMYTYRTGPPAGNWFLGSLTGLQIRPLPVFAEEWSKLSKGDIRCQAYLDLLILRSYLISVANWTQADLACSSVTTWLRTRWGCKSGNLGTNIVHSFWVTPMTHLILEYDSSVLTTFLDPCFLRGSYWLL